jgi:hypothetical protein
VLCSLVCLGLKLIIFSFGATTRLNNFSNWYFSKLLLTSFSHLKTLQRYPKKFNFQKMDIGWKTLLSLTEIL